MCILYFNDYKENVYFIFQDFRRFEVKLNGNFYLQNRRWIFTVVGSCCGIKALPDA